MLALNWHLQEKFYCLEFKSWKIHSCKVFVLDCSRAWSNVTTSRIKYLKAKRSTTLSWSSIINNIFVFFFSWNRNWNTRHWNNPLYFTNLKQPLPVPAWHWHCLFASQCQFAGVRAGKQMANSGNGRGRATGGGHWEPSCSSLATEGAPSVREESQTLRIQSYWVLSSVCQSSLLHGKLKFILDHQRKAMIIKWEFNVFVVNMKIFPEAYWKLL